jgi:hypothetical protein
MDEDSRWTRILDGQGFSMDKDSVEARHRKKRLDCCGSPLDQKSTLGKATSTE